MPVPNERLCNGLRPCFARAIDSNKLRSAGTGRFLEDIINERASVTSEPVPLEFDQRPCPGGVKNAWRSFRTLCDGATQCHVTATNRRSTHIACSGTYCQGQRPRSLSPRHVFCTAMREKRRLASPASRFRLTLIDSAGERLEAVARFLDAATEPQPASISIPDRKPVSASETSNM